MATSDVVWALNKVRIRLHDNKDGTDMLQQGRPLYGFGTSETRQLRG